VAALPGRERRREQLRYRPRADDRLTGVDAGRLHPYEDCPSPGTGRSTSSTRNTSIPPNPSYLTAFGMISASPFCRNTPDSTPGGLAPCQSSSENLLPGGGPLPNLPPDR